jgi:hypothetical protein
MGREFAESTMRSYDGSAVALACVRRGRDCVQRTVAHQQAHGLPDGEFSRRVSALPLPWGR